jgi:hypothetical protein
MRMETFVLAVLLVRYFYFGLDAEGYLALFVLVNSLVRYFYLGLEAEG